MKIDYELAEKIGAKIKNEYGQLFKFDENNQLLVWCDEVWRSSTYSIKEAVDYLKPIPPKPPVRIEYEKVTESIFDLKDEFERGNLYYSALSEGGEFVKITPNTSMSESYLVGNFQSNNLYRRIEKPVDWKFEVRSYLNSMQKDDDEDSVGMVVYSDDWLYKFRPNDDEFLEMCRVALHANGEL